MEQPVMWTERLAASRSFFRSATRARVWETKMMSSSWTIRVKQNALDTYMHPASGRGDIDEAGAYGKGAMMFYNLKWNVPIRQCNYCNGFGTPAGADAPACSLGAACGRPGCHPRYKSGTKPHEYNHEKTNHLITRLSWRMDNPATLQQSKHK